MNYKKLIINSKTVFMSNTNNNILNANFYNKSNFLLL